MSSAAEIDIQRRRDGAFFEDWSEWRDLGSPDHWARCAGGMRRRVRGVCVSFFVELCWRLPFDGRSGFEVHVPKLSTIDRLLRPIKGAHQPRIPRGNAGNYTVWYVPAEEWEALRLVLPRIKAIVTARYRPSEDAP